MEEALETAIHHIKREGAVLPDYAGDGPLPSDEVAPTSGPPGNGNRAHARPSQGPEGRIGFFGQQTALCYRIVYVEEDEADGCGLPMRQVA